MIRKWKVTLASILSIGSFIGGLKVGEIRVNVGGASTTSASSSVVQYNGTSIEKQIVVDPAASTPATPDGRSAGAAIGQILENGGFENGVEGWGTGWYEGLFIPPGVIGLRFGGAVASWTLDDFARSGRRSLRAAHTSDAKERSFSSFGQLIRVEPGRQYQVTFWAYLKESDKGSFALRVTPSRTITPAEWEANKAKLNSAATGRWQVAAVAFTSGAERSWDLRFTAEAPATVWVDDVSVADLGPATPRGAEPAGPKGK